MNLRSLATAAPKTPWSGSAACSALYLVVSSSTGWKRMRGDRAFFDTNVLIYAFAKDERRTKIAETLLSGGGVVGVQTLNEFVAVAVRKLAMPWDDVLEALSAIRVLFPSPVPLTVRTHDAALRIARRYGYHIYDSLVIAAALEARCNTLFSEDMKDNQAVEGLTIRDPFREVKARRRRRCPRGRFLGGAAGRDGPRGAQLDALAVGGLSRDGDRQAPGDGNFAQRGARRGDLAGRHIAVRGQVRGYAAEIAQHIRIAKGDQRHRLAGGNQRLKRVRQFPAQHAHGAAIRPHRRERRHHVALTAHQAAQGFIQLLAGEGGVPGVEGRARRNLADFLAEGLALGGQPALRHRHVAGLFRRRQRNHAAPIAHQRYRVVGDLLRLLVALGRIHHVTDAFQIHKPLAVQPHALLGGPEFARVFLDALARQAAALHGGGNGFRPGVRIARHEQHIGAGLERAHRRRAE